ncbi:dienelactone hydrolase family protein [Pseudoxanthomonas jiangsuensis]|uniref:dienelactone hydrolase family protein n=1 Tax=Pseudoxanthomonas jiangsuensis TaxID=619688 RepID=UPI001B8812F0|nr:dienelactone hydrolase family protein [Pseudoxanthomonas jiangsuensis]
MMEVTAKDGGVFRAYLALPASGRGPGIVIGQEIFGVNANMRAVADRFAEDGYVALVPDLFWRLQPGIELGYTQEEFEKAFGYLAEFDQDQAMVDIAACLDALQALPQVTTPATGFVGYCLGGRLAYLAASRTGVACAVGFYGVNIENLLHEAPNISCKLVLHFAEQDRFAGTDAIEKIFPVLGALPDAELYRYPGVDHAFARVGGDHYDEAAAELAHRRTLAALQNALGKPQ